MSEAKVSPSNPNVSVPHEKGVHIVRSATIDRPANELYKFWNDLSRLPELSDNLESVQVLSPDRAHLTLKFPAKMKTELDAEIYTNVPNEVISWRSLPESEFQTAGSIRFRPAPGNRGTEVQLTVEYVPAGGAIGKALAEIASELPSQYVGEFLRKFKQLMEAGEKATNEGQSSGRNESEKETEQ